MRCMAEEQPERDRNDEAGGDEQDTAQTPPPEKAGDVAGDVDARRLEITPERPNRRPEQ